MPRVRVAPFSAILLLLLPLPSHASDLTVFRVLETFGDSRDLTCVVPDGETLWFGTLGAGMLRSTGERIDRFGASSGLPGERVRDCRSDGVALWVATDAGVARWDEAAARFVLVASGRFLRLAMNARTRLAADGGGRVFALEPDRAKLFARLEFAPSALALAPDGRWAAGGSLGQLFVSDAPAPPDLRAAGLVRREPIEALAFDRDALQIRTTDHGVRYASGRAKLVARRERPQPPAAGVRIQAEASWRGGSVIATDRGAFVRASLTADWRPLPLAAALPCGDRISALAVHRGVLWAGSFDQGLCRRDATGWTQIRGPAALPSDLINDLASDGTRLYVATAQGLAVLEPDGQFRKYEHRACIGALSNDCPWAAPVNGVALDAVRKQTWIADLRAVHRLAPRGWQHIGGDAVGSLSLTRIAARDGEIAVGSGDQGVLVGRGKRFERIDDQAGLADNWVMDLTYDTAGRLWVATCTRGVSVREPDGRIRTLTRKAGLIDDYTLSVTALEDAVLVGTLSGLSILKDGAVQNLTTADGLSGNEIHAAVELEGKVWLATDAGLSVLVRSP